MYKRIKNFILLILISTVITACGGGGGTTVNNDDATIDNIPSNANPVNAPVEELIEASNSSSISWSAPTTYEDGSTLSPAELGGYRIYVGSDRDNLSLNTDISDSADTNFSFAALGNGIKYIAVTSYDTNGNESRLSDTMGVNIN